MSEVNVSRKAQILCNCNSDWDFWFCAIV